MAAKSMAHAIQHQTALSPLPSRICLTDNTGSVPRIVRSLREHNLSIASVELISHATQIRLTCGAIVNVFTTGTVTVQGKVPGEWKQYVLTQLQKALPATTRCCL